jgi:tRNA-dihydrouridine synthase
MANAVLVQTAAAGVMVGSALLRNPQLFDCEGQCSAIAMCREYLELAKECHSDAEPAHRHMFSTLEDELGSDSALKAPGSMPFARSHRPVSGRFGGK